MPDFPPLFEGRVVVDDPAELAVAAARDACEPGLLLYRLPGAMLEAALVLAPEVTLDEAAAMILVAGNALADALGALAPPEIALHLDWPGGIRVEGARCGGVRALAAGVAPDAVPGWLVLALSVPIEADDAREPGETPDVTALRAEGIDLPGDELLGAWARHMLSWIVRWEDEGMAPVHRHWTARAWGVGQHVSVALPSGRGEGVLQGLDERGGILLKGETGTRLIPLWQAMDRRC